MNIDSQQIFEFLTDYGYWIMLPLMIIEGPVITIIGAFYARLGTYNIFVIYLLSILGDIVGDVIFYALGRFFGYKFVRKWGKYIGITESLVHRMEKYFKKHGGKTIFAVKSTTGLCWATFTTAGIVKMDFKKFLKYSVFGGFVWSALLVLIGYFYGYMWQEIEQYIKWAGWIIFALAVITIVGINVWKKRKTSNFTK